MLENFSVISSVIPTVNLTEGAKVVKKTNISDEKATSFAQNSMNLTATGLLTEIQQKKQQWKVIAALSFFSLAYASSYIAGSTVNCEQVAKAYADCRANSSSSQKFGSTTNLAGEVVFQVAMLPWTLFAFAVSCSNESQALSSCEYSARLLIPKAGAIVSLAGLAVSYFAIKKLTEQQRTITEYNKRVIANLKDPSPSTL